MWDKSRAEAELVADIDAVKNEYVGAVSKDFHSERGCENIYCDGQIVPAGVPLVRWMGDMCEMEDTRK